VAWEIRLDRATLTSTGARVVVIAVDEEQGLADVINRERLVYAASDPPPPLKRTRVPLSDVSFEESSAPRRACEE
jgi:hypothetical protein